MSNESEELIKKDILAAETAILDDVEEPRETLQTIELSANHIELSHADLSTLDIPDIPTNPRPIAAMTTEADPVDATFAVPRTNESRAAYENDCVSEATFKLEELKTEIEANSP
jgi:hypothetical protein